jgi:crotonobetainyl-CoA:carnitine CoA-transferase CaiB-like acyl-CoA transferase
LADPAYATNAQRVERRAAINAAVEARTRTQPTEHWIAVLNAAGVPCGRVQTLGEVFDDPQVRHSEMKLTVDHPGRGPIDMLGFPVKFATSPCRLRHPAPELGAHTDAVLSELGLSSADIAALREKRVI